jgi:TPP-dependent pyruvate/acetoin dehydrogenase alpha subunit
MEVTKKELKQMYQDMVVIRYVTRSGSGAAETRSKVR